MFDAPEYTSYIALCRELRLERKAQTGDWFIIRDPQERPDDYNRLSMCGQDGYQCTDAPFWDDSLEVVWLPCLDQWLAMLEEAGFREFRMWPIEGGQWGADWRMDTADGPDKDRWLVSRPCSTREEAAARLWIAVRRPAAV